MNRFPGLLAGGLAWLGVYIGALVGLPAAENNSRAESGAIVQLFDAMRDQQIEVTVRPRDAHQVRVEIKNNSDEPLRVNFPEAFAAVPVNAQFFGPPLFGQQQNGNGNQPFGNQFQNQNGNGSQQPQALGVGARQNGLPRARGQNNVPGGVLFNVPAGKIVRVTMESVCLEYGKREPNPRSAYELRPLDKVSDSVALRELLESYGNQQCDGESAQLAAWHLASDMSWDTLQGMTTRRTFGKIEKTFTSQSIEQARKVVDNLPSKKGKKAAPRVTPISFQSNATSK